MARAWPRIFFAVLVLAGVTGFAARAKAEESCPTTSSDIDTDRPDTTNSSAVVPSGSLQDENDLNLTDWRDGTRVDGTDTRLRLGIADCAEILVDLPNYTYSASGVDGFIEYVGDYPSHAIPSQVMDFGAAYRITPRQQLDFRAGVGLTRQSPAAFFGLGYSFRADSLF
jgi:hypothetical protein